MARNTAAAVAAGPVVDEKTRQRDDDDFQTQGRDRERREGGKSDVIRVWWGVIELAPGQ